MINAIMTNAGNKTTTAISANTTSIGRCKSAFLTPETAALWTSEGTYTLSVTMNTAPYSHPYANDRGTPQCQLRSGAEEPIEAYWIHLAQLGAPGKSLAVRMNKS
jgi:hypothetical protein